SCRFRLYGDQQSSSSMEGPRDCFASFALGRDDDRLVLTSSAWGQSRPSARSVSEGTLPDEFCSSGKILEVVSSCSFKGNEYRKTLQVHQRFVRSILEK